MGMVFAGMGVGNQKNTWGLPVSPLIYTNRDIYPVAYHSQTFTSLELNYDTYNKKLLAIFKAFKTWRHFLKRSGTLIDVVTDHKNLEYFSTTKLLTH